MARGTRAPTLTALLAALLAGCTAAPAPVEAEANQSAGESEPPIDLSWERAHCPQSVGEISEHPEADARADFTAGKRGGVGFASEGGMATPGLAPGPFKHDCAPGLNSTRLIKALAGDVATCLDVAAMTYIERYNRELSRLCEPVNPPTH